MPTATEVPTIATDTVLAAVEEVFNRYVIFPSPGARDATVLWTAHTHVMGAWRSTPRLAVMSPNPGSGKTRVLELLDQLVPRAVFAVNLTPVVLWRALARGPVILFDEADTIFGRNGSASAHQQLRAIINAGDRRSGTVIRASGTEGLTEFPVYGACALAGLGALPETIANRSIVIQMRPRAAHEHVEPLRLSDAETHLNNVRDALTTWGQQSLSDLTRARPAMPVADRQADVWEALVAIADHADGKWPERARNACRLLTAETGHLNIGTLLLTGVQALTFARIKTEDLLAALYTNGAGWTPRNLDAGSLARHLAPYDIKPGTIRFRSGSTSTTAKGYYRRDFVKAWEDNLPSQRHAA